ncbi:hypothetical protein HPP92_022613 [Vanilla planifolia]|uniref:ATP-dependent DNA ligase family profile domain-containing protein n=1 Tax=Vanilla planifolia TaxID=51239 RepID=A0A835PSB6_VANPL|nr:hypothetical protein HPP92_022613 [Vanilla planifolia]
MWQELGDLGLVAKDKNRRGFYTSHNLLGKHLHQVLRAASSKAQVPPLDEAAKIIKQVYSVLPDYGKIVPALLRVGVLKLSEACNFSLGVPVGPMLAKPTKSVSEILDKFQGIEFTCEYKYDGERAQIHYMEDGSIEIYSRNAERNTGKYPDVFFPLGPEHCARKGVILSDIKVAVCTFAFDILYINGRPLLHEQLKVRREELYKSFDEVPGEFYFATTITSNDLEEIQKFLENAVSYSCEGLIIKTLDQDATYEPSKRSNNWLKLKKDYMDRYWVSELQLEERSESLHSKVIARPKGISSFSSPANGCETTKTQNKPLTLPGCGDVYRAQKINHMHNNKEDDDDDD